jgi:ABC-2 type transport system ATP-binding protein
MNNSIELHDVTNTFGQKIAVDRLDLAVPEGSIYGFIGPNGSGKTTTLRLILRILQPDTGSVIVLGAAKGNVADDRLGYLPEERGLYKRMKVADAIAYFARLKGFFRCREAIREWLERLGAANWANQRIDTLSKGMAQKVQFIVAAIARPKLLVLDEPFAGLDPVNLQVLRDAVLRLRANGTTIVLSTHDMNVAEQLCDTVLMVFDGRKVLDGTLSEIQRRYPISRLRMRVSDGENLPGGLPGVTSSERVGGFDLLSLAEGCRPQEILRRVAACCTVEHFEIVRPTLHDIFVEIARPPAQGIV